MIIFDCDIAPEATFVDRIFFAKFIKTEKSDFILDFVFHESFLKNGKYGDFKVWAGYALFNFKDREIRALELVFPNHINKSLEANGVIHKPYSISLSFIDDANSKGYSYKLTSITNPDKISVRRATFFNNAYLAKYNPINSDVAEEDV